ncbi:CinA family protein [Wenxinia saemankumensis]|uniref:Nicotinamide-nucleotide amidase n=1 Tax=Wenxinia saemankumensis TaxID=1447782 RepID=A0A1M6A7D4_9RHOB|nr:CinA family protein [Wenxinia saemankumensis]SHI32347.1 nicotinamide-nucleotide amidase [Wenxinia saemankumensis]
MNLAAEVIALASDQGATLACAESCTGGLVAAALTDIAGSSAAFDRGFVTYSNAAKTTHLGVPEAMIAAHGAVSEEVARAMAEGARRAAGATLAVSTTGIAGPGGSEHKPEGRVCFGLATAGGTRTETVEFGAIGRSEVRAAARDHALRLLLGALSQP